MIMNSNLVTMFEIKQNLASNLSEGDWGKEKEAFNKNKKTLNSLIHF